MLQLKRSAPPADNGMVDCFDSVSLDNPLRYYKNYSYNACMNEVKHRVMLNSVDAEM